MLSGESTGLERLSFFSFFELDFDVRLLSDKERSFGFDSRVELSRSILTLTSATGGASLVINGALSVVSFVPSLDCEPLSFSSFGSRGARFREDKLIETNRFFGTLVTFVTG